MIQLMYTYPKSTPNLCNPHSNASASSPRNCCRSCSPSYRPVIHTRNDRYRDYIIYDYMNDKIFYDAMNDDFKGIYNCSPNRNRGYPYSPNSTDYDQGTQYVRHKGRPSQFIELPIHYNYFYNNKHQTNDSIKKVVVPKYDLNGPQAQPVDNSLLIGKHLDLQLTEQPQSMEMNFHENQLCSIALSPALSSLSAETKSSDSSICSEEDDLHSEFPHTDSFTDDKRDLELHDRRHDAAQKIQSTFRSYLSKKRLMEKLKSLETEFKFLSMSKKDQVFQTPLHYEPQVTHSSTLGNSVQDNISYMKLHLIYDADARIVLGYEQQLVNLLLKLDEIPSKGHQHVKHTRKLLIQNIQDELNHLDHYKKGFMN